VASECLMRMIACSRRHQRVPVRPAVRGL